MIRIAYDLVANTKSTDMSLLPVLWILSSLLLRTEALTCLSCNNVAQPSDCTHVVTCKEHEECGTYEKTSHGFDMGCRPKLICDIIRHLPIIGRRAVEGPCRECCDSSTCNNRLCTKQMTADKFSSLQLTMKPTIQAMKIGATAMFDCSFHTQVNESMTMTWSFTGSSGTRQEIYSSLSVSHLQLNIKSAQANDTGVYTCRAEFGPHTWEASGQLVVPGYLNITTPPVSQTVMAGGTATFFCAAVGDPTPTIHWQSMIGRTISNITSGVTTTTSGSQLIISHASHAEEGLYTCITSNAFGSHEAWAVLAIIGKGQVSTTRVPVTEYTSPSALPEGMETWHLQMLPLTHTLHTGVQAVFECKFDVDTDVTATMKWSFTNASGHTVDLYSSTVHSPDLELHVKNIEASDSGTYTCEVRLGQTTWTATATLTVIDT